ncbi:ATP-binding protein [soil metagenome]
MSTTGFERDQVATLCDRLCEPRRFIQVVAGPRQVGKTTLIRQALRRLDIGSHYASADQPTLRDRAWIETQWLKGRQACDTDGAAVLVLDEAQKVAQWSEVVKRLWDEDTSAGRPLHVVLSGSAPLLVQHGLTESLAGRFEMIRVPHWSLPEMQQAFGWDLDRYIFYGGYPGAAPLIDEPSRWANYILDSLIETTLSRDVLLFNRIDKPALLRQLFELGCRYSGQILAYTKMLGQLHDAGNTTTLAHYLQLLDGAGLITGLERYSGGAVRRRASSPKLIVRNTALLSAVAGRTHAEVREDGAAWGRLVESAVGAHLLNSRQRANTAIAYWRHRNREVDFVVRAGERLAALEVKTGAVETTAGMDAFAREFGPDVQLLIGADGIPVDEFLRQPVEHWVEG